MMNLSTFLVGDALLEKKQNEGLITPMHRRVIENEVAPVLRELIGDDKLQMAAIAQSRNQQNIEVKRGIQGEEEPEREKAIPENKGNDIPIMTDLTKPAVEDFISPGGEEWKNWQEGDVVSPAVDEELVEEVTPMGRRWTLRSKKQRELEEKARQETESRYREWERKLSPEQRAEVEKERRARVLEGLKGKDYVSKEVRGLDDGKVAPLAAEKAVKEIEQEALKYKTAEEFIRSYRQSHLMDLSTPEKHWLGRAIPAYSDEPFTDITQIIENKDLPGSYLSTMRYSNPVEYKAINSPSDMITVYRAVPENVEGDIRVGDYVALDKGYAQMHLDSVIEGQQGVKGKIISKKVPKKDVVWGEADFTEWAYSPKSLRDKYGSLTELWNNAQAKGKVEGGVRTIKVETPEGMKEYKVYDKKKRIEEQISFPTKEQPSRTIKVETPEGIKEYKVYDKKKGEVEKKIDEMRKKAQDITEQRKKVTNPEERKRLLNKAKALRGRADYFDNLSKVIREVGGDPDTDLPEIRKYLKKTAGPGNSMSANEKTLASLEFCTNCPLRQKGKQCPYCYVESARRIKRGKSILDFIKYDGHIAEMPKILVDVLNKMGGYRVYSFGDYMEEHTEEVAKALEDARKKGLMLKFITKQNSLIKKYGKHPNARFQISTDSMPNFMSDAVTPEKAAAFRKTLPPDVQKKVKIRYVARNEEEAEYGGKSKDVDVLTLYHGNNAKKMIEYMKKERPDMFKENRAEALKEMGKFTNLDNKDGERLTEKYKDKTCCSTGVCATCKVKCGYAKECK